MKKQYEKLFSVICFIGLSTPLWFSLCVVLAFNAVAPGFRHDVIQPDTTEYYRMLPQRIKHINDSLLTTKQDKVN